MADMLSSLMPIAGLLLRNIDPETAHNMAIAALEKLPLPACAADDPRLAVRAFGLDFANPLGMAAGFDKDARVPRALIRLGFGFVEVGGVTRRPQAGNPRPRVFRLPADGAVINRYGLNSEGMEAVAARLERRGRQGILGINLGANKDSADRIADYVDLTRRLGPLADYLTLNVSSPNTPGLRDLQGKAFLDTLIARVLEARGAGAVRILLKIAPDLDDSQLDDIIEVSLRRKIDGLVVSNTTIARPETLRDASVARETGGLSGRPLFRPSTVLLAKAYLRVEGAFPLIGVGGIASGEDAVAKIGAGATLLQLYTALVFTGPGLIGEIKRAILRALAAEKAAGIPDLVGRNAATWAAAGR